MAINFPTSLDVFTDPTASDQLNLPSHSGQHTDLNNAVEALEAKVGINSSAVTSSHDYKIAQLEARTEGKILQVVSTTKTDTFTTTSTSFADVTGLSLTITPTSATSKVLVFSTLYISGDSGASTSFGVLVRDSTSLFIGDAAGSRIRASFYGQADVNDMFAQAITYLDSPATTSAVTYKVQVRSGAGPGVTYVNRTDTDSNNNQYGRFASSVTALEVAG